MQTEGRPCCIRSLTPYIQDRRWKAGAQPDQAGGGGGGGGWSRAGLTLRSLLQVLRFPFWLGSEDLLACRGRLALLSTLVLGRAGAAQS